MSNFETQVAKAAEATRDRETEAFHADAEETPYTKESWHSDCADFLISGDPEVNNKVRMTIARVLEHLESGYSSTPDRRLTMTEITQYWASELGGLIIRNAIKQGLTAKLAGNPYE